MTKIPTYFLFWFLRAAGRVLTPSRARARSNDSSCKKKRLGAYARVILGIAFLNTVTMAAPVFAQTGVTLNGTDQVLIGGLDAPIAFDNAVDIHRYFVVWKAPAALQSGIVFGAETAASIGGNGVYITLTNDSAGNYVFGALAVSGGVIAGHETMAPSTAVVPNQEYRILFQYNSDADRQYWRIDSTENSGPSVFAAMNIGNVDQVVAGGRSVNGVFQDFQAGTYRDLAYWSPSSGFDHTQRAILLDDGNSPGSAPPGIPTQYWPLTSGYAPSYGIAPVVGPGTPVINGASNPSVVTNTAFTGSYTVTNMGTQAVTLSGDDVSVFSVTHTGGDHWQLSMAAKNVVNPVDADLDNVYDVTLVADNTDVVVTRSVSVMVIDNADQDGDGLMASAELAAGTDPRHADTDRDGINDGLDSHPLNLLAPASEGWNISLTQDFSDPDVSDVDITVQHDDILYIKIWSDQREYDSLFTAFTNVQVRDVTGATELHVVDLVCNGAEQVCDAVLDVSAVTPGSYSLWARIKDLDSERTERSTGLTILPSTANTPPVIHSVAITSAQETVSYSYAVQATDSDGDTLSYNLTTAPASMVIDSSTGQITWVPAVGSVGNHDVTVSVNDGQGGVVTQSFQVVVSAGPNTAPLITSTPVTVGTESQVYSYTVTSTDAENDTISYSLSVFPTGMTIDSTSGVISWAPGFGTAGSHSVTVLASDGLLSASQSFSIVVASINQTPVANDGSVTVNEDSSIALVLSATDANAQPLTYRVIASPTHGQLTGTAPNLTYTPNSNYYGSDSFSFRANDGIVDSNTATVSITVNSVNDIPQWQYSPGLTAQENVGYTATAQAVDVDNDTLTYSLSANPAGMTINATTGDIYWLPDFDQAGGHSVTVAVDDGQGGSNSDTFIVNVANTNRAPVITSPPIVSATENLLYQYTVVATDADIGNVLVYSLTQAPADMSIDATTGLIHWVPVPGQHLVDIAVTDDDGAVGVQIFTIDVLGSNSLPIVEPISNAVAIPGVLFDLTVTAADSDGDSLTFSLLKSPSLMSIDSSTGQIHWVPENADIGNHTIDVLVSDGKGSTEASFDITITLPEQLGDSTGKSFWLLTPQAASKNVLHISSQGSASGFVTIGGSNQPIPFSISDGGYWTYEVYRNFSNNDTVSLNGIYIQSDNNVAVNLLSYSQFDVDAYTAYPEHSLGLKHRVASYNQNSGSFFNVLATEDSTGVWITPSSDYVRSNVTYPAGSRFHINLNKGESYQLKSTIDGNGFTGSLVDSDKPVTVIGAHECTNIPHGASPCDRLISQLPAVELWGDAYYLVPLASRLKGDTFRVIADEDDTYLSLNSVIIKRLSAGEYYEFTLEQPGVISGSKPILVMQYSNSTTVDYDERLTIPNSLLMQDVQANGLGDIQSHNVTIDPAAKINYVLIVTDGSGAVVTVDGNPIDSSFFQDAPYGNYNLAQVMLPPGDHIIQSTQPIRVMDNTEFLLEFSDPFMMVVPPDEHYLKRYSFVVPSSDISRHFINVVVPTEAVHSVVLDSNIIDSRYFEPIVGTEYSYAKLGVNVGHHTVSASKAFGLSVYGFTRNTSYGYVGGRRAFSGIDLSTIALIDSDLTKAVGEEACFDFRTLDASGNNLNFITVDVSVSDQKNTRGRIVTDENGSGQFCYSGPIAGSDTVSFSNNAVIATGAVTWSGEAGHNLSPKIVSMPVLKGEVDNFYSYDAEAVDPNSIDTLSYRLKTSPQGMVIDSESGLITWPLPVRGAYDVELEVSDGNGLLAVQRYQLVINAKPFIVQEPNKQISTSQIYNATIFVNDPDGFAGLTATLIDMPALATIRTDYQGFFRIFLTIQTQALPSGTYPIRLRVTDTDGAILDYSYDLDIIDPNTAPVFSNIDWTVTGLAGEPVSFDADAVDNEGDNITYSLAGNVPTSMSIDPQSGLIQWDTPFPDANTTFVTVVATDDQGASVNQQIDFQLSENFYPVFTSEPVIYAREGAPYRYAIQATDPDNRAVTYSKNVMPANATVDPSTGLINWTPTQSGVYSFSVTATDGVLGSIQQWVVNVSSLSAQLTAQLSATPHYVDDGSTIDVSIVAQNPAGALSYALTLDGQVIPVDDQGRAAVTLQGVGRHQLTSVVSDGVDEVTDSLFVYVKDSTDVVPPSVVISTPIDNALITEPVDLVVTAYDDNITEVSVYSVSKGGGVNQLLYRGNRTFNDEVITQIDPTLMTNGLFTIIVQATDINGQSASDNITIQVDGDLKVGNFSFTVADLTIPMAGIPIQVNRSYDSRQRNESGDFGYGWSLDYQNIKVEENRALGTNWALESSGLIPAIYCIRSSADNIVTVTLPNGDMETFKAVASPECNANQPILDVNIVFTPVGNTTGKLVALNNANGRLINGHLVDPGDPAVPLDPGKYQLTTQSGYIYQIDQVGGIEFLVDPNGHTLTYTNNGISHSDGKSITFTRDPQTNRITEIKDPSNNVYRYRYDANNDLVEMQDANQVQQSAIGTRYTYNNTHGLVDIIDPLNRPLLKNIYDDSGRLIAQEDGNGIRKTFNHDLAAKTSIVTDLENRSTVYHYDDRGNVLSEAVVITDGSYTGDIVTTYTYDANDNQETRTVGGAPYTWTSDYDTNNNQLFSRDPEGHQVNYSNYNARGQEGSITDERGHSYSMVYDANGNLEQLTAPTVIDPDSSTPQQAVASNVINGQGQVQSSTDLRGTTTTYTYYTSGPNTGLKHTESHPKTGTVTYTYDSNANVKSEQRERSVGGAVTTETVSYDYDALNRLIKTTYPDNSFTETEYDLAGNVDRERDRFGNWTEYDYDAYRRLIETRYPDGSKETRTYYREGDLHTVVDRSGHTTEYLYDDARRLIRTNYVEAGTFTRTDYTPQGWVLNEWDENGERTEYEYDLAGRRTAVIRHGDGTSQRHSFSYYANGELHTETDALSHTTTYVLNELDQRIQTTYHNTSSTQARYDALGARTAMIDQEAIRTDYGYDNAGRLDSVQAQVTVDGGVLPATTYSYDEVGNKLSQTDAEGRTTSWTYDYYGRVLSRTLPELMAETFSYDDVARTTTHTDFNGDITITTQDNMGRVERIDYQKDNTSEVFTYWDNDQLKTVTDQHGVTQYFYDLRDRLSYTITPDGTRLDYQYDNVGNRTQVQTTRGTAVTTTDYSYDGYHRLQTVTDSSGVTSYTYDAVGNLDTVSYPNGLVADYDYNSINQLTTITTRDSTNGNAVVSSYSYGLKPSGRRESITEHTGRVTTYSYDDLYRLKTETITDAVNGDYSASYTYDFVGNRAYETVDGVQTQYSYDNNDRLQSQGGTTYTYDDNGNTLTETLDGVITTYSYDGKNKLVSVDKASVITDYSYNHNGIRTSKSEGATTTAFIVDENRDYAQVLEEIVSGNSVVKYSYGHDLLNQDRGGVVGYYHYDGLGSVRSLTDTAGATTDVYNYEAFGEVLSQTGTTENGYLFAGEQLDQETNQYYLRARYYDPSRGFTQMDSWLGDDQNPITLNKYLYANADAVNHTDPSGNISLAQVSFGFSIGAILATTAINSGQNALSLDRTSSPGFGGMLTAKEIGISVLLQMVGPSSTLWNMALSDPNEKHEVFRVEDELQSEVERLRERDSSEGISVPVPPRKKGWFTCIARAQDLGRLAGMNPVIGWGWGLSKSFQVAKNQAVQMANLSIGAVDTHHAQWRCLDPKGQIIRPQ